MEFVKVHILNCIITVFAVIVIVSVDDVCGPSAIQFYQAFWLPLFSLYQKCFLDLTRLSLVYRYTISSIYLCMYRFGNSQYYPQQHYQRVYDIFNLLYIFMMIIDVPWDLVQKTSINITL